MIHRHPIIHRYNVRCHVYIRVLCFYVYAENNQITIIIQPIWNSHCFEITIYFRCCHFLTRGGPKIFLICKCMYDSQDAGSLRKKNKKKKRGKVQNTRTSSGDSDVALNMTNSTSEPLQPDHPASHSASKTASSAQVWFSVFVCKSLCVLKLQHNTMYL